MKAITLIQPYATLVAIRMKRFETRDWGTDYRGPLAIHAAARFPRAYRALCELPAFRFALQKVPRPLPRGAVVAIANLSAVVEAREMLDQGELLPDYDRDLQMLAEFHFGDWSPERRIWDLGAVRQLPAPIPAKGGQRFWYWNAPAQVMQMVAHLEKAA